MRTVRRLAAAVIATALVSVVAVGVSAPAHAEPNIPLYWGNVTGETVLAKPKVTVPIPKSTFSATIDLADGSLVGDLVVPELTMKMKLLGFAPLTSTVRLVPVGQTTAKVDLAASKIYATSEFTMEIVKVSSDWTPDWNLVPAGCSTSASSVAQLENTAPIDLGGVTPLAGSFEIPAFQNCGILTPLLTHLISGPGNTMAINLSN